MILGQIAARLGLILIRLGARLDVELGAELDRLSARQRELAQIERELADERIAR